MVILFGSFASGDWVEDPVGGYFSELDVLVIVKSPSMVDKVKLWSKIEDRARRITKPTSLSLIVEGARRGVVRAMVQERKRVLSFIRVRCC
jgi:predicted nucleotidyltransferase